MSEILLSEEERFFVVGGVAIDNRVDGRTRLDYRSGNIEVNVVTNSHGSLRLQLGESDVIIATKVDLGVPSIERPDQGTINFLVDCSPTATPDFEGKGGDELGETICRILSSAYVNSGTIDLKPLCIVPQKFCYIISVDILVLQCGGNVLDVISMGVKACLGICEIPRVAGTRYDSGEPTPIFTKDEYEFNYLDVSQAPLVVTLPRIGIYFVVDPSMEEESCSKGKLCFGVSPDGNITSLDKLGRCCYQASSVGYIATVASKVGIALNKILETKICNMKASKPQSKVKENTLDTMDQS